MTTPQHDTPDIIIAATLWLMCRYQQTGCRKFARMIEQHLTWMRNRATNPRLADACRRLSFEWHRISTAASAHPARPTLH